MTIVTASSLSLYDFSWRQFLKNAEDIGFQTLLPRTSDVLVDEILAHPQLKLLLHARPRVEYFDGDTCKPVATISSAYVYGMARLRDDLPETVQPTLRVSESWLTAVASCRSFRLSVRTGLQGIEKLQETFEFLNWFEPFPINLLSYAAMNPFGSMSANDRYAQKAFRAFLRQDTLPAWFVDFAFPYRDLREWEQE